MGNETISQPNTFLSLHDAAKQVQKLRSTEEKIRRSTDTDKAERLEIAKKERSAFINTLLCTSVGEWLNDAELQKSVSVELDVEGLRLDAGPLQEFGVHSHIPYSELSDSAVQKIVDSNYMQMTFISRMVREEERHLKTHFEREPERTKVRTSGDLEAVDYMIMRNLGFMERHVYELKYRTEKDSAKKAQILADWNAEIASEVHEGIVSRYASAQYKEPRENPADEIADTIFNSPEWIYGPIAVGSVPEETVRYSLERKIDWGLKIPERVHFLFENAEIISVGGSFERIKPVGDWAGHRHSHAGARVSTMMYESRKSEVQSSQMYEAVKAVRVLLSSFSQEELAQMEIRMARTSITTGKGNATDCIALWSRKGISRVFISPKDHVREDGIPPVAYAKIPEVPKAQFQGLEALMTSYGAFQMAKHEMKILLSVSYIDTTETSEMQSARKVKQLRSLQELAYLVVSEIPPVLYEELDAMTTVLKGKIVSRGISAEDVDTVKKYQELLVRIEDWFVDVFTKDDPRIMLADRLTFPNETLPELEYNNEYFKNAPAAIAGKFDMSLVDLKPKFRVFEAPKEGLPYGREAQAVHMLRLKRRPTIEAVWGALKFDPDAQGYAMVDTYLDVLLRQAIKYRANVIVPGTQTKATMLLAKKYYTYVASLSADERELLMREGPRFFSIEPGGDAYFPGSMHFTGKNPDAAFPLAPFDSFVTPYPAGWNNLTKPTEFRQFIHTRQTTVRRIAENLTVANFTINGGPWAPPENAAMAFDGADIIAAGDMGRHGFILAGLKNSDRLKTISNISDYKDFKEALSLWSTEAAEYQDERERAEIVGLVADETYVRELQSLLQNMTEEQLFIVNVETVEEVLEENLKQQLAQMGE